MYACVFVCTHITTTDMCNEVHVLNRVQKDDLWKVDILKSQLATTFIACKRTIKLNFVNTPASCILLMAFGKDFLCTHKCAVIKVSILYMYTLNLCRH